MRVLLCTPYLQAERYVKGGINIWGNNLVDYYLHYNNEIEIDYVSFDRIFDNQENTPLLSRIFYGLKDYWSSIKTTKKKLDKEGPYDVLHLCTSAQLGLLKDYVVIRIAHQHNVKVALHLHFGRSSELLEGNNWESIFFRKVIAIADSVIAIDDISYKAIKNKSYHNSYYLPNPLSLPTIQLIEKLKYGIKRVPNKVLYVGHVIPSKGIFELVEACMDLAGIELHLVGTVNDEIRSSLSKNASKRDNGNWLIIHGGLSHEKVIEEMLSCDVFALPSYTEGFPNVILESMACGCAIVATKVGAIPEMLSDDCGICIEPKNISELRNGIKKMIEDDIAPQYRINAQKRVYERYAMPTVWSSLVKIWESTR